MALNVPYATFTFFTLLLSRILFFFSFFLFLLLLSVSLSLFFSFFFFIKKKKKTKPNPHVIEYETVMVQKADDYFAWAMQDARIMGLAPWHWDTRSPKVVSFGKEIGTADMPQLRARWQR